MNRRLELTALTVTHRSLSSRCPRCRPRPTFYAQCGEGKSLGQHKPLPNPCSLEDLCEGRREDQSGFPVAKRFLMSDPR